MNINKNIDSPFETLVSFNKFVEHYEAQLGSDNKAVVKRAQLVLQTLEKHPELREGIVDTDDIIKYEKEIKLILQDAFNPLLTHNEIKTASAPFHSMIFNSSERFRAILKTAGDDFELEMKNMPQKDRYIIGCTIILRACYGYYINFKRPFYYEIPDASGITRYYKILYNADFMEVIPKTNAPKITKADYEELLDNYDNIEIWKEKFPPSSYMFRGFVISNIFDVTDDQSISNIKSSLIGQDKRKDEGFMNKFYEVFRSLFGLKNLQVGFSIYNEHDDTFERVYGVGMNSFLLSDLQAKSCLDALCKWSYKKLLKEKEYISISDVDKYYTLSKGEVPHIKTLYKQGIKSAIFAPIANEDGLMGILEIVSQEAKVLNSINANKLVDVMPYIVSAVERSKEQEETLIDAIIQKECTSIHPSVHWRFVKEAKQFIKDDFSGNKPSFNKIAFNNVYPLFGQIDIKGSSEARNYATKKDLMLQLSGVKTIIEDANKSEALLIYSQFIHQINEYLTLLETNFQVDSEQQIASFFEQDIDPLLLHLKGRPELKDDIDTYFNNIDEQLKVVYKYRKDYDNTITFINKEMASILDAKQKEAQAMYPHYFERYKTDGVEHNMYIGESLTEQDSFNPIYLYNLRLWQLQVMCEMENSYYQMKKDFPVSLDVASMILVFNRPLSISFRMDEKQFDVDGTYNARYEIVKKRVDKAYVKGTSERVTQKGKISIIYSQKEDELEYMRYIKFLQSKHYLDTDIEVLELQDLQAVTGLKAIRVSVLYHKIDDDKEFYTYEDLMKEIN